MRWMRMWPGKSLSNDAADKDRLLIATELSMEEFEDEGLRGLLEAVHVQD